MPHDLHPQVEDHALAGPGHDVLAGAVDHGSDEQDRDQADDELIEQGRVLQADIEHPQDDLRPHQSERGGKNEKRRREDEVDPVRPHEAEESSVHRDRRLLLRRAAPAHHHEAMGAATTTRAHPHHHDLRVRLGPASAGAHFPIATSAKSPADGLMSFFVAAAGGELQAIGIRGISRCTIFETCL